MLWKTCRGSCGGRFNQAIHQRKVQVGEGMSSSCVKSGTNGSLQLPGFSNARNPSVHRSKKIQNVLFGMTSIQLVTSTVTRTTPLPGVASTSMTRTGRHPSNCIHQFKNRLAGGCERSSDCILRLAGSILIEVDIETVGYRTLSLPPHYLSTRK